MRYFKNWFWALFTTFILMFGISAHGQAYHDPSVDMGIGKVVGLSGWCYELEDARELVRIMHTMETEDMVAYYMAGDNSCHHVRVMSAMTGLQPTHMQVELIAIVEEVVAPDGTIAAITKARNIHNGRAIYTWHHFPPNET